MTTAIAGIRAAIMLSLLCVSGCKQAQHTETAMSPQEQESRYQQALETTRVRQEQRRREDEARRTRGASPGLHATIRLGDQTVPCVVMRRLDQDTWRVRLDSGVLTEVFATEIIIPCEREAVRAP